MKKLTLLLFLTISLIFTGCHLFKTPNIKPIEGTYDVQGWNPGSNFKKKCEYEGTATVKKDGDSYSFTAKLHNVGANEIVKYYGPCIYSSSDKILSLTWKGSDKTEGCDIFYQTEKGFDVDWVYLNEKEGKLGKEIWTKK
jgi:hypothetical protein